MNQTMFIHSAGIIPIMLVIAAFIAPIFSIKIKKWWFYSTYLTLFSGIGLYISLLNLEIVYRTGQPIVYPFGGWPPPLGIVYEIDFMNAYLGALAMVLALIISIYTFWYFPRIREGYEWITTLMLLLIAGVVGCLYTGDIFNFFVMLEVVCISSYALVAFFRRRRWAVEASTSYAFIGALATTIFLFAVIYIYAAYGTLNMADIAAKAHGMDSDLFSSWSGICRGVQCFGDIAIASAVAVALALWALTFEAGIFPNNFWIPSAYAEAPTIASAYFAGIVDKVGTYAVLRIFFTLFTAYGSILTAKVIGFPLRATFLYILSILGLITGYLGALLMAIQNDVKKLLAYSTISHIGMLFTAMIIGVTGDERVMLIGFAAILFHMLTHALAESMAFLGLGTFSMVVGSRRLDRMAGLGKLYPGLGASIAISLLSLLGLPPLAGFFSKYMLFLALVESGYVLHAISIILISGISAIGYFRVLYNLFMLRPRERPSEKTYIATAICIVVAVILLVLGVLFIQGSLIDFLRTGSALSILKEGVNRYIKAAAMIAQILSGSR